MTPHEDSNSGTTEQDDTTSIDPQPDEMESLAGEREILRNARDIIERSNSGYEQLYADDDSVAVRIKSIHESIAEMGKETLVATAGFADLEGRIPVAADIGFFIGSVSKNLFATVALKLVDQGRIRLDSPLSTYVEWPRGDEVTIKMLLNHTSGIPEYMTEDVFQKSCVFRSKRPPIPAQSGHPVRLKAATYSGPKRPLP